MPVFDIFVGKFREIIEVSGGLSFNNDDMVILSLRELQSQLQVGFTWTNIHLGSTCYVEYPVLLDNHAPKNISNPQRSWYPGSRWPYLTHLLESATLN